jgi:hypothetical protein
MRNGSRREFLGSVGKGMLVAGLGVGLADALEVGAVADDTRPEALSFGSLEPLAALMQETAPDALMPLLVQRLRSGTPLRDLVAAGALANARSFGGEDYIGFHTFMALSPALAMSRELPADRRALPVLKVLYRNAGQIQAKGGRSAEVLQSCHAQPEAPDGAALREEMRARDLAGAERSLAGMTRRSPREAFEALQALVQDELDVHRVVLAYRAWGMLDIAGKEHAATLLRQSLRYCVRAEQQRVARKSPEPEIRGLLPRVIDQHRLLDRPLGTRDVDDAWIQALSLTVLNGSRAQAADAVGAALAEGVRPEAVGEALSLAATHQVLRDPGRPAKWASPDKPVGSVHGDSPGVHASDSVNAWRNIAAVGSDRNAMLSLVAAAAHVSSNGVDAARNPYPLESHLKGVRGEDAGALLAELHDAVRTGDQARATAVVQVHSSQGHPSRPVFDLLLRYAVSEDGSLHAEKYYRTVTEEYARGRRAFRHLHLTALARVTASEFGRPAPGHAETCRLLGLTGV